MKLIIYTNTDFIDIFKIQYDHINKCISSNDVIIFSNDNNILYSDYTTYLYNDTLTYPQRILSCLNQIHNKDKYYIVIHDNDILLKYNEEKINNLVKIMEEDNIHRCDLHTYESNNIIDRYGIQLRQNSEYYLFSVGPCIWNTNIYEDVLIHNNDKSYRDIEGYATQYMIDNKYSVYNAYTYYTTELHFNRIYPEYCLCIHITSVGRFILDTRSPYYNYLKDIYLQYNICRPIYHI